MTRTICRVIILLLLVFGLTSPAQALTYNVVDAGSGEDVLPQDVLGTYTENGTQNGKPCYEGPNGYWLYFTQWFESDYWFIGKPLGNSDISNCFYISSSSQTPPLDINFFDSQNTSGAVKVTTSGGSPPPAPGSVFINSATASSFTCHWSDVSSATGYKLDVSTSSDFSTFVSGYDPYNIEIPEGTPFANRPTYHVVNGLSPGTTYYFRMRAFNGFGDSANSSTASVTTIPGTPTAQAATNVNEAGFIANWSSQSGATGYRLFVSTTSDFSSHVIDNQYVSNNYYTVTGLLPNTTYYYRVKAVNTSGESGVSGHAQVITGPVKPVILDASNVQSNEFTANWQSSAGATSYFLDVATDSSFNNLVTGYVNKNVENVTSYQVNQGINAYTTYYLRVRASNANGTTTNSSSVSVTTLPVMATVTSGTVSDIGTDSAVASGNITNLGVPGAGQHGFCWNTTGLPTTADLKTENGPAAGTGTFTNSLSGLHPDTMYYLRAYATNVAGTAYGEVLTFTTQVLNAAPTVTDTTPTLSSTGEDTTTSPILVSSFLDVSDPDPGALSGVAISSVTGNGTWQYSLDGTTWSVVGVVSDTSALLLRSTDYIRYAPDGINGETATVTFRAWDQTLGVHGSKVDILTNGSTTAFSDNTGTATLKVDAVNDDPTITGLPADVTVTEDTASNLDLSAASFGDVDAGANPVTLTLIAGSGTITSASGGGVTVSGLGTSILTLTGTTADIDTFLNTASNVQYQGALNLCGNDADTITLVANDGGNSGSGGGTDVALGSVNVDITAVNDAPTVTGICTLTSTDEDTTTTGVRVSTIMTTALSGKDVDGNTLGAAITAWNGNGAWQYSTDSTNGLNGNWSDVGSVSDTSALLLSATTWLRYVPDYQNGETATITFRAWDQTSGVSGSKVDTTTNGGTTAFSVNTGTATLAVTSKSDPPSLDLDALSPDTGYSTTFCAGGSAVNITGSDATLSDVDLGDYSVSLTAELGAAPDGTNESLALNASATAATAGLTVSYDAGTGMLSITGAASPATYETILRGIVYHNAADQVNITTGARTISVIANDGESDSNTAQSTVTVVNAPIIDLDGGWSSGSDTSASFTEGEGSLALAPSATINEPDGDNLNQLVIQLTNDQDGTAESLTLSGGPGARGSIVATYDLNNQITLSGTATAANYQALLRELTYNNASQNPDTTSRAITTQAKDINGYLGNIAIVTVSVIPVNDAPTLTANSGATLDEGATVTLTSTALSCSDPDNTGDQLTYNVVSEPVNGSLMLSGSPLAGGSFTQDDIDNNRISYTHGGSETTSDSFTFTVTDGAGGSIGNTTFAITVNPVNDAPVIVVNQELTLDGGNTVTIGNDYLAASDADNTPGQLTYTINTATASGTLYKDGAAITAGGTFTQRDIDNNQITCTHDNSETTADSFSFTVADGAGGSVNGTFNISIEPTVINPGASGMTVTTGSVAADGTATATITVVVKNVNENPLAGHTVTLDQGGGSSIISPENTVTSAEGAAVFTVKSDRAETVTYTAYDETDNKYITQTVQVKFESGITVHPTSGSTVEGQSMQYEVALVSQPAADVVISANYGGQLELDNDSLTFTPANYNVPKTVIVTAVDDDMAEGLHWVTVSHSVYSTDAEYDNYDMADVTVAIIDNDSPGISVIQSGGLTQVTEAGGHDSFDLVLTTRPADSVTVSVYGDWEVDVFPETLLFSPGNWNVLQSVAVTAVDDNTVEFAHTGTVTYAVYSSDFDYNGFMIPDLEVQITDNDLPGIASLAGLTISSGTLTPAFDPAVTSYTAGVPNRVNSLTVTATPQDDAATIIINNQPVSGQSGPISLNVGDNTISVLVTAQDGSTKEYVITVRRAASSGGSSDNDNDRDYDNDSNSDSSGNITPPDEGTKESIKSDSGGSVSHDNVTVDIPPDALPSDATVSIAKLAPSEANKVVPAGLRVKMASDVYEIATSGEREFGDNTITVKIAYDPAKAAEGEYPAIHYYDENLGRWVKLKTEHAQENGTWYAVTRVNHLTKFTVFSVPEEERQVITLTLGQVQASVNGSSYTLDAAPYVEQKAGRTLVPVRFVSEALGADVQWDAATQQVTILSGGRTITITLNSNHVLIDGQSQEIDCAPVVLPPGRTFVPLRSVSETLGSQVDYNAQTKQVTISGN